jgi:outer membrane protein OmpA-like peptidoglycan-associated protein
MLRTSAEILRDSPQATADVEGLLQDCTFVGLAGNQQFFTGEGTLRGFTALADQAEEALVAYGLLLRRVPVTQAAWNYTQLAAGLLAAPAARAEPRFNPAQVERLSRERELKGATKEGVLFEFEILFEPNQNEFAADLYRSEFTRVLNLSATYPGAIILVEGHADPLKYLQERQAGRPAAVLDQTKQAAKNLSVQRAVAVRESVMGFGRAAQLALDSSQFTVAGAGIDRPKHANPSTEGEWRANMRVAFQIVQVEAELERFSAP